MTRNFRWSIIQSLSNMPFPGLYVHSQSRRCATVEKNTARSVLCSGPNRTTMKVEMTVATGVIQDRSFPSSEM
jgi:hypothetical protein